MKKRIMSLVLALVMCVGLAVPAVAASEGSHHYEYMDDVSNLSDYAKSNAVFTWTTAGHMLCILTHRG